MLFKIYRVPSNTYGSDFSSNLLLSKARLNYSADIFKTSISLFDEPMINLLNASRYDKGLSVLEYFDKLSSNDLSMLNNSLF